MRQLIVLSIILMTISCQLHASDYGRYAKKDELIGFWKYIPLANPKINKKNPWPQPFQWFAFYKNGRAVSMQSNKDENMTAKTLDSVFNVIKDKSPTYQYKNGFMVVRNAEMKNYREIWGVNIFLKDAKIADNEFKRGDLMMSLDDGKGNVMYYRHLRRLK